MRYCSDFTPTRIGTLFSIWLTRCPPLGTNGLMATVTVSVTTPSDRSPTNALRQQVLLRTSFTDVPILTWTASPMTSTVAIPPQGPHGLTDSVVRTLTRTVGRTTGLPISTGTSTKEIGNKRLTPTVTASVTITAWTVVRLSWTRTPVQGICSLTSLRNTPITTVTALAITTPIRCTATSALGIGGLRGGTGTVAWTPTATVRVTLQTRGRSLSGTSNSAPMFGRSTPRNGPIPTVTALVTTNPRTPRSPTVSRCASWPQTTRTARLCRQLDGLCHDGRRQRRHHQPQRHVR